MCAARVVVADDAGACYGVERALGLVLDAASSSGDGCVWTLGPVVHNPRVVEDLQRKGVRVASTPSDARGATLVLRAHGVTPQVEQEARTLCEGVVDATCPFVRRVHAAASRMAKEGRQVIVVGDAGHAEVEGILGHAPGAIVVGSADEARSLEVPQRVAVVAQTTQAHATFEAVVAALEERGCDVEARDTICDATSHHQEAAARLAGESDVMVVVGGRGSANTRRLLEICEAVCPSHLVEGPDELDAAWFEGAGIVGVTAGASTPASHIEETCGVIRSMVGE